MEAWKDPQYIILWLVVIIVVFLFLLFFIVSLIKIGLKKSVEKKEAIFNEKLKYEEDLKASIVQVQDQERKAIASELHDQISNKLNLLILKLNELKDSETDEVKHVKVEIRNIIEKNRDISHYLFPVEIENIGLFFTLNDLSYKYKTNAFCIDLYYREQIEFENKNTELQLYRIIQESLTNTLKYADANIFSVQFKRYRNKIFVLISDNGKGCDLNNIQKGLGFKSIETRLNIMNAQFKYKSKNNLGTRLIIVL